MKVNLFAFQRTALKSLRQQVATAIENYRTTKTPQIVSYTAPTGAGKTIIMAALIESIYYGDEIFPEQNDAIFVWLSDSPQLNEQSRIKIETKAEKCFGRCVTISDDSFDREILEDGHIYFLNTQKLSKSSNLTKISDMRQHTIWETLSNTAKEKADRLYFIIDEAHRGTQEGRDLAKATTIMQKFLKGSEEDNLPSMPLVIGMTATAQRFNRLAENCVSTTHHVVTTTDEVRASGLLKDRIIITYPEKIGNDMAVLQAASDEWKDKCKHWKQYCVEQHYTIFNPIMVVQVQNAVGNHISATNLDECIRIIEERTGERFIKGQVVHAFGEGTPTLVINGLDVPYVEPSHIADDKRIKIVLFKEALSTGWDCPRAETMMSFRHANDYTYIAQLLGRMIRTPMRQHINVDESLNEVHLYLPQFNEQTVQKVVEALRSTEGATIPTDIEAEAMGTNNYDMWTVRPTYSTPRKKAGTKVVSDPNQTALFNTPENNPNASENTDNNYDVAYDKPSAVQNTASTSVNESNTQTQNTTNPVSNDSAVNESKSKNLDIDNNNIDLSDNIDREGIVKAINNAGLLTYNVRNVKITDYLKSMFDLSNFLTHMRIDLDSRENVISDIINMIHEHIADLKKNGTYDDLTNQVLQFKLNTQIFDVFGKSVDNYEIHDLFSTTDTDIERQFRFAEAKLGNEGVGNAYCNLYYEENDTIINKIDVIIFAANSQCIKNLHEYARKKFHELNDLHRRDTVTLPEKFKKKYDDIVSDGDIISKHNFRIPDSILVPHESEGIVYSNHLFVDDSGTAVINLNGWEQKVIEEEQQQSDFICWLRNPPRRPWSLCIPYEIGGDKKPTYPDFLIIRHDGPNYIIDILEPHDPTRIDNLGKAKGFAEYARQNPGVGKIQLIKVKKDTIGQERPFRLDMSKSEIRDKVIHCVSIEELNHIFDEYGFFI